MPASSALNIQDGIQNDSLYVATVSNPGKPDEDLRVRRLSDRNVKALSEGHKYAYMVIGVGNKVATCKLKLPQGLHFRKFSVGSHYAAASTAHRARSFNKYPSGPFVVQVGFIKPGKRTLDVELVQYKDLLNKDLLKDRLGHLRIAFVAAENTPLDKARVEADVIAVPQLPVTRKRAADGELEVRNRELLLDAQREMLGLAPSVTSEQLATRLESTTTNASQLGQDLRTAGRLFGVRFGKAWHYPQFQLETSGKPFPEVLEVLSALGKDERGWAYLKWFLEPNHKFLQGKTPLAVWGDGERRKVVEAAGLEHWQARD
jgi:hypothetical protein